MADGAKSLKEYLESPTEGAPCLGELPDGVISALSRFVPLYSNPFFIQWKNVKNAVRCFAEQGVTAPVSVSLIPKLKSTAYAVDGGKMCFSLGAILSRSSAVTLTVLCHEITHVWLSQRDFYPDLKRLNKDFISAFSGEKAAYLMSPIEVYAMVGAIHIMDAVCASLPDGFGKRKLERLKELEKDKLDALKIEISMLKISDSIDSK